MRVLRKTAYRIGRFLADSLAWRGAERAYALIGWALLAGLAWIAISLASGGVGTLFLVPGHLVLFFILAAVCAIDARFGIIPDTLVVVLAIAGLVQRALAVWANGGPAGGGWLLSADSPGVALLAALSQQGMEAAVVFAAAALLRRGYRAVRGQEGLGFGDVKFIAAATIWTGLAWIPFVVLTAVISALGSIAILRHEGEELHGNYEISFGPHLAIGVWLAVLVATSTAMV